MIKAIIFDCFGVVLTDALLLVRQELQRDDPQAAAQVKDIITANNHGLMEPAESNKRIAEVLHISVDELKDRVAGSEVRNKELLTYISSLRKKYKTAMLSNIAATSLARRFPHNELDEYFDVVVASGEIGFAKPEPEAYEITADRLGVRLNECVFTDDRELFCDGATSVGMQAILYTNFAQFKQELNVVLSRENS